MILMCSLDSCMISRHERIIGLPVYRWRWKPVPEPHGHWRERHNAAACWSHSKFVDSACSDRMRPHGWRIWRLLAKQLLSNCKKDYRQRCSFLKGCATCHQHRRPSNIVANGPIFIHCRGNGMMMMHHQTMTPKHLHGSRHHWKLSDYNKDNTSLQQQDSYISELQQM